MTISYVHLKKQQMEVFNNIQIWRIQRVINVTENVLGF
jgi:hypothetical protein